ncbi:hypothetical protein NUU61_007602, partial [Penicillium alfredii]
KKERKKEKTENKVSRVSLSSVMTAVAKALAMNSNHESGTETGTEHSPSRFTAVNGKDSMLPGANAMNLSSSAAGNGRAQQDHSEQSIAEATGRPEDRPKERDDLTNDLDEQLSQRSSSQEISPHGNKNKRKRSESGEQPESVPNPEPGFGASRSPARRPSDQIHTPSHPNRGLSGSGSELERGNASVPPNPRPDGTSQASSSNGPWPEYESPLMNQARAPQIDTSDAQLADALQREAQGQEPAQRNPSASRLSPGSTPGAHPAPATYPPDRSAAVQVAPKRKRVFSNRTKTGCMTCRRRKKKCDEQHPACNNCIRGGFLCEGYSSRSTWQKPSGTKTPVPLQSKEGYPEISGHYIQEPTQHHDRQPILTEHVDAGKVRPLVVDDSDRSTQQYNTSPTAAVSNHGSWSKRAWPSTGHTTYVSDHIAKPDYREVPPIHELSREGHPKPDYPVVPPIRELSHGPHPKSTMALFQAGVEPRPLPAPAMDTSTPQAQARMALNIEHQLSGRAVPGEESEKEKMIRGELYRPFDIQLVEERDRCKGALWRFNNACNPLSGVSSKEQNRLLKEILVPPSGSVVNSPSGVAVPRSVGSIGQGAVVEAPFNCHYGYNIHVGEDVMISENCLFVDDCLISIGAHTWIGPNVTVLSSMAHANMQERKGSQSRYQGRPVTIEEDCYVGAGCTIYPGVRLRRGAYVAPGEVVKSDIVAYGFQGLKPSYM